MELGRALLRRGATADAIAAFELAAVDTGTRERANLANDHALTGRADNARTLVSMFINDIAALPAAHHIGVAYVGLVYIDAAFEWLERAVRKLDPWVTCIKVDPAIQSDLRLVRLARQLNLVAFVDVVKLW